MGGRYPHQKAEGMTAPVDPNLAALIDVAEHLGDLRDDLVFLGGATVSLMLTEAGAHRIRVTKDVDCLVEVASLGQFHELDARIRAHGFVNDVSGPVCRYALGSRLVDIMPTQESIVGFASRWAREAVRGARWYALRPDLEIKLVTPAMLLTTKLEAFLSRGRADMLMSHDLEDVIALVDGRPELASEVLATASQPVRAYLHDRLTALLADSQFAEAIEAHLPPDTASQARAGLVHARLERLASLE
jgi:predicted nucleotidyltransferase